MCERERGAWEGRGGGREGGREGRREGGRRAGDIHIYREREYRAAHERTHKHALDSGEGQGRHQEGADEGVDTTYTHTGIAATLWSAAFMAMWNRRSYMLR
jgi:hypothetical protein